MDTLIHNLLKDPNVSDSIKYAFGGIDHVGIVDNEDSNNNQKEKQDDVLFLFIPGIGDYVHFYNVKKVVKIENTPTDTYFSLDNREKYFVIWLSNGSGLYLPKRNIECFERIILNFQYHTIRLTGHVDNWKFDYMFYIQVVEDSPTHGENIRMINHINSILNHLRNNKKS